MSRETTILIVDDEPFNRDILEQELEGLGYATLSAENGREAVDKVRAELPDLVLLDVMMPVLDGFDACRILKGDDDTRLIPIIIMTALDGFEDRIKGIEAGADDFLTKPVNERELQARIRTALRMKQAMDAKLERLSSIRDHLEKFVPVTVKEQVAINPDSPDIGLNESDVSVLFLDISGYTKLCEDNDNDLVNSLIERHFTGYLDRIHAAGGDVCQTMGDGMMAVFRDDRSEDHSRRAVETSLQLFDVANEINSEIRTHPLSLHMGVNSGLSLVGSSRFEGVNGTRWIFTATGPAINMAARLAALAEDNTILIGPTTAERLGESYQTESIGFQSLKNFRDPVEVFSVKGRLNKV